MDNLAASQQKRLNRLAHMGILLAEAQHLPRLYDLIVREAIGLSNARMGAIYMRHGETLVPAACRSEFTLDPQSLDTFATKSLPLIRDSLCGEIILQDKILNLADVRTLPEGRPAIVWPEFSPFRGDEFRSLLALPLQTPQSGYLGVLLLLNAHSFDGELISFDAEIEELMIAVAAQAALAIQNLRAMDQLHEAYQDTLYRLSLVAKYREDPSGSQIRRVSQYSEILARAIGFPEDKVAKVRVASALYDIGKLGIPEAILLKPGKLTPEEFDRMKQHTTLGSVILGGSKTEILQIAEKIALTHHEKFDGTGYPNGMVGEEIPPEGRIVAVAEVFDALTSERPYKTPMTFEQGVETIRADSGKHFDPVVVEAFLKTKDQFLEILKHSKTASPKI